MVNILIDFPMLNRSCNPGIKTLSYDELFGNFKNIHIFIYFVLLNIYDIWGVSWDVDWTLVLFPLKKRPRGSPWKGRRQDPWAKDQRGLQAPTTELEAEAPGWIRIPFLCAKSWARHQTRAWGYQLRVEPVLVQQGTWFLPDLRSLQSCISPQVEGLPFKCVRYSKTVGVIIITYFLNTKWVRVWLLVIAKVVKLEVCCVGLSICLCFPGKVCPYRREIPFLLARQCNFPEQERTHPGTERLLAGALMQCPLQLPRNHQKLGFTRAHLLWSRALFYLKIKGHVIWACIVASDSRNFSHGLFPLSF